MTWSRCVCFRRRGCERVVCRVLRSINPWQRTGLQCHAVAVVSVCLRFLRNRHRISFGFEFHCSTPPRRIYVSTGKHTKISSARSGYVSHLLRGNLRWGFQGLRESRFGFGQSPPAQNHKPVEVATLVHCNCLASRSLESSRLSVLKMFKAVGQGLPEGCGGPSSRRFAVCSNS